MSVTEVDPVNYGTIIGDAGGVWRKSLFPKLNPFCIAAVS